MGITTFSGPVRSDNGFQEWNGSEWVPVAGGGGGGSANIYIPNTTGMGNVNVTIPTLENGQSITYVLGLNQFPQAGDQISFSYTPNPGDDLGSILMNLYAFGTNPLAALFQDGSAGGPIIVPLVFGVSTNIAGFSVTFTNSGPGSVQGFNLHYIVGFGTAVTSGN